MAKDPINTGETVLPQARSCSQTNLAYGYVGGARDAKVRLEVAYSRMKSLTAPRCGNACGKPEFCCKPEFCEETAKFARETYDVQLSRGKHPVLPFMGEFGCLVPPYLRPHCTIYICENHLAEDPTFALYYRQQREDIDNAEREYEESLSPKKTPSKRSEATRLGWRKRREIEKTKKKTRRKSPTR